MRCNLQNGVLGWIVLEQERIADHESIPASPIAVRLGFASRRDDPSLSASHFELTSHGAVEEGQRKTECPRSPNQRHRVQEQRTRQKESCADMCSIGMEEGNK